MSKAEKVFWRTFSNVKFPPELNPIPPFSHLLFALLLFIIHITAHTVCCITSLFEIKFFQEYFSSFFSPTPHSPSGLLMLTMKRSSWQRRKLRSSSSSSMRFCSQAFFSRATYRWARRFETRMKGLYWEWGGSCTAGSAGGKFPWSREREREEETVKEEQHQKKYFNISKKTTSPELCCISQHM